jgi:uncharacterized protein involved in outer membrane biogenesis
MKKWLILAGVVLAVVALLAFAVANLDSYLDENRGWIERQAAEAVGRPVTFDRAGVSLWPGLAVEVQGLRIADDVRYSEGSFVEIEELRLRVALLSAIFGELDVSGVALSRPVVTLVQTRDGFNFDTLGAESAASVVRSCPRKNSRAKPEA